MIDAIGLIVPPHLAHLMTSTAKMRPRHDAQPNRRRRRLARRSPHPRRYPAQTDQRYPFTEYQLTAMAVEFKTGSIMFQSKLP